MFCKKKKIKIVLCIKNNILWGNDNVRYKGEMLYYTKWINTDIIQYMIL